METVALTGCLVSRIFQRNSRRIFSFTGLTSGSNVAFEAPDYNAVRKLLLEAPILPAHCCISKDVFERERRHIFFKTWHFIGRSDELPNSGDFHLINPTDLHNYNTRATGIGGPKVAHGKLYATDLPGLGVEPDYVSLGDPVAVYPELP